MRPFKVLCICVILLCSHVQSAVVGDGVVQQQELIIDSPEGHQDTPPLLHSSEDLHPDPTPGGSLGTPTLLQHSESTHLTSQPLNNSVVDEQDVDVATAVPSPANLDTNEGFDGYDRFIAGLRELVTNLNDPAYDWEAHRRGSTTFLNLTLSSDSPQDPTSTSSPNCACSKCSTSSSSCSCSDCIAATTLSPTSHEDTAPHPIESLFALVAAMKQLSEGMQRRTGRENPREQSVQIDMEGEVDKAAEIEIEDESISIITDRQDRVYESVEEYLALTFSNMAPKSLHPNVNITTAVSTLSRLYQHYFGQNATTQGPYNQDGLKALVENVEALSNALHNYSSILHFYSSGNTIPSTDDTAPSNSTTNLPPTSSINLSTSIPSTDYEDENGLQKILVLLKSLLGLQPPRTTIPPSPPPTTTIATTTTNTTATTSRGGYALCEPPFEEIAYHMCILQEVTLRLSWSAAQLYCRERGAELAMDPVVIKARRYLNNLYGEDGSRVRWPMWIGGKRVEDGSWRWQDGSKVMRFLWSQGQPRYYAQSLIPHGTCMILDGYQSYNGAALPCHLRRRFVCQRRN
ncbi:hypothetical protein Pcinc_012930 [Petrolisthes cinctipes]|uniref:C-type lectin domain-containing protein n=1 Tax=Petrolisthes cinctipes TaxID=88211 RepID=A0AAE1FZZ0_PETCI|nr:hypothetical protein Pcinc_012930 [Petrolisthes cinctipes]